MNEYLSEETCGPSAAELADWLGALRGTSPAGDDAERIDRIRWMEQVKSALAAAQAREAVAFTQSQLECQKSAGVRNDDLGRGISAQVALARRESPHRGGRLVGLANALVGEMPQTLAAMEAGELSEWRATLMVRETACLRAEDRVAVDARLAGRLASLSDRQIVSETRKHAYTLDPYGFVNRFQRAEADRRVTLRPAPDTMSTLSALLPAAQGVAVLAELSRDADARRAAGDPRTRGQLMADTLVERVTGLTKASGTPVDVQLVMTDCALFLDDETPARLNGFGAVPAAYARRMVRDLDESAAAWVRRLYSDPATGRLVQMDSTRRTLDGNLRTFIVARDEVCRTPWCGAPIRHGDHVVPVEEGGPTSEVNGQGLCEACNHAKQAPGWRSRPGAGGAGELVRITTPTGHMYTSRPPPLPNRTPLSRHDAA
ncbi:MAG: DUF222 domain-containing protein [Nocardioidaceae bacterium]